MASGTTRSGLSGDDLIALTDAVAQGARATVYLRDPVPGVGLQAGTSAKVISVNGTTVLVRPRGVDDELPFEADELQMKRTVAAAPRTVPKPRPAPKPQPVAAPQPASAAESKVPTQPKAKSPRTAAGRRKTPTTVTVTLHADLDGAWTVAVQQGDRPAGKAVPVHADAVERAVAELDEPGARRAVASALESAREVAAARVAELTRQLEQARGTLAALGAAEAARNGR